jgi:hypothetical protein
MTRVVILMQENKTPDYYFPTLTAWGADIRNNGHLLAAPPIPVTVLIGMDITFSFRSSPPPNPRSL